MISNFQAQQGWQCPVCKRVYSPFTPCCFYCGEEGMTKTSTSTGTIEYKDDAYVVDSLRWTKTDKITPNCNDCANNGGYPSLGPCKNCDSNFSQFEKGEWEDK